MADDRHISLRLVASTDVHGIVAPHDYLADCADEGIGMARVAGLMDAAGAGRPNVLRFDNGDLIQGAPLADLTAVDHVATGGPNPVIRAMDEVGYDAGTLGNHDFNFGLDHLIGSLRQATHPVVVSNLTRADGRTLFARRLLLPRRLTCTDGTMQMLRIGVLGLIPPQTLQWDRAILNGVVMVEDIVTSARREALLLRAEGADIVIALAHTGLGQADHVDAQENAVVPLAAFAGLDAIFAGHTHQVFPDPAMEYGPAVDPARGTVHGIPVAQAGAWGERIAVIDLEVAGRPGAWRVTDGRGQTMDGQAGPPAPAILAAIADAHDETKDRLDRVIGESRQPLHTYFAMVSPSAGVQLLADAQLEAMRAVRATGDLPDLPLLCAASPTRTGGTGHAERFVDVPAGPVTMRHVLRLAGFPNAIAVVEVTGAALTDWLDRAVSGFRQLGEEIGPLIDPRFAAYNFDAVFGARYGIDLSEPARYSYDGATRLSDSSRIRDLSVDGRPFGPDDRALVVTSTYRAGGGGHFAAARNSRLVRSEPRLVRTLLVDHLEGRSPVDPAPEPTWHFRTPRGARALFRAGPGIEGHLDEAAHLGLTPCTGDPTHLLLDFDRLGQRSAA